MIPFRKQQEFRIYLVWKSHNLDMAAGIESTLSNETIRIRQRKEVSQNLKSNTAEISYK